MQNVTTEKAVKNQIASAKMEGFAFNRESVELIKRYTNNEISHEKLVELVTRICAKNS